MIEGHGGPHKIVASHPSAFNVAFETNLKVKQPVGEVAV